MKLGTVQGSSPAPPAHHTSHSTAAHNRPEQLALRHGYAQHHKGRDSCRISADHCRRTCRAPYAPPGTEALAESIVKTLGESGLAAVLERHGMIAVSPRDVDDAFRMAVHVEETAKAYYRMASLIGLEQVKTEV